MAANRIQLQNALHKPYDRVLFSREVLSPVFGSGFTLNSSLIPASVSPNKSESAAIANVWVYGKIQLDDSTEITCYEVLLQPKVRIEQSKVAIQQYVRKLLTVGQAALINFVAPANINIWRLTLVAKDSVLTEKGVKEKTTNAKRYTFLLGPSETCKTAAERFETLSTEKEISFQTLVNAFSVEKLSKAFFDEYTLHYQNFCDYLQESNYRKSVFNITFPSGASKQDKDKASKPIRDFVKKLLGRIVFLYFVQKKGWLGASDTNYTDGLGDFIKQLFNKSGGNDTFYSNWLTVLFFETLNKERINDDFKMPDGKPVKVPFLNGGLFDKEEFDEHLLTFKSKLFHHPDFEDNILTEKSKGNARGFLDFLDAFNFTIYEDSPDDHTVAVDPEILGHIFENLLEDNKDKGAFYTPKEIVHYMCQESLTEYLCTTLQIKDEVAERESVNHLLKNKVVDEVLKPELAELEKALDNVKICDPAIGSGAFPMGLLQEIFSIKELIAYETGKEWKPAETKLNIIQNSIYGVDIEKGAVDIARLRFWLSLVVDEEKPKPLPNLDYKIVVGDSLISKFDGEIVEIDWERKSSVGKADEYVKNVQRLLVEVADKQKKYFNPNNKNKKKLQAEIRNLKIELLINQLSFNKELYIGKTVQKGGFMPTASDIKHNTERELQIKGFDNLISKLKNLLKIPDEPFNHFDWKLDFPEVLNPYLVSDNAGFDIVIANPPYIDSETMVNTGLEELRKHLTNKKSFCKGNWDIYIAFFDVGYHFLNRKGNLVYITPDKWISKPFGYELRKQLKNKFNKIAEAGRNVFQTAKVDSIITFINNYEVDYLIIDKFIDNNILNLGSVFKDKLSEPFAFDWLFSPYIELLNYLDSFPNRFIEYGECENACATSDAYKLKEYLKDINSYDFNSEVHFKVINTGTISKYVSRWGISEMTYLKDKANPTKKYKYLAPVVDKKKFLKDFSNSYSEKSQKPKIIIKGLTLLDACLDYNAEVIPGKSTLIITKTKNTADELFAILSIINSKLPLFYIKEKHRGSSYNQGVNFNTEMINNLPIPQIPTDVNNVFKILSKYLIFLITKSLNNVPDQLMPIYFEQIIDGMVYELYFPELLKKHNREIIKHLGELPEFTDNMSNEQKMKICKMVFDRLNDKEHPVRVNLFYMNSIPEIAIIEGKNENN
ncbi:MAG: Eco57I restriction-modification methylase domain-containing protein [Bacteroidales bacterium]|nr:Eco57I restriction-modification methylase domain-containing protein [Bacteroidales bacterium]